MSPDALKTRPSSEVKTQKNDGKITLLILQKEGKKKLLEKSFPVATFETNPACSTPKGLKHRVSCALAALFESFPPNKGKGVWDCWLKEEGCAALSPHAKSSCSLCFKDMTSAFPSCLWPRSLSCQGNTECVQAPSPSQNCWTETRGLGGETNTETMLG